MTIYAIGDIHGQRAALEAAHEFIAADMAREGTGASKIVHIGDYCDRGPDVKGTLNLLISAQAANPNVICLAGNHDKMMLGFLDGSAGLDPKSAGFDWLNPGFGGLSSLESYGISASWMTPRKRIAKEAAAAVPAGHVAFLRSLPLTYETPDQFFVHAGINPARPLRDQFEEDLLWIRNAFLADPTDHGKLIVHGHTPVEAVEHMGNRVDIDTGAGFDRALSTVAIEGRDVWLLDASGRRPVKRP